jgi:periplasmic protein TonB
MIHNDHAHPSAASRARSAGRLGPRRPLPERKRSQRRAARLLIARHTRRPPTATQLAFDPLTRPGHRSARRRALLGLAVAGSLAVHAATVIVGLAIGTGAIEPRHEEVKIEMRQQPPEVAPEPPPEIEPVPPASVERPTRQPAKVAKLPTPPATQPAAPPQPTKTAPVRVVGLRLESTGEGGDGPSFAVGNTRMGETDKAADAPKAPMPAPPFSSPGRGNQVASHIPVGGIKYERPRPRKTPEPEYPPDLKSQGIEADVMVLASIDADGKVTSVKVIKEAPYPTFNEAARAAVLTYEYEPATRDGVPTPYQLSFTVRFRVKDND